MTSLNRQSSTHLKDNTSAALELPSGARFYRCALQINPFEYLERHKKQTEYSSEEEYNDAIIKACIANDIEVIAVTDHYRVKSSKTLVQAARKANLFAFDGFEAVSKDGVHFLCLFDPTDDENLERFIGACGVKDSRIPPSTGILDSVELLDQAREWGAIMVAAHVTNNGGLLKNLRGEPRIQVWKSPNLLACAIPGPVKETPDEMKKILQNKEAQYKRPRAIAVINASDVNDPKDLEKSKASCFIKMSEVSVEGLRQAFLAPESRLRLNSDATPKLHAEICSITWEGGFLDGISVRFNSNLNTLIGGRGVGKSTIIESIRYALGLEPLGEEAQNTHKGVVKHVLKPGTKVSLVVRSQISEDPHYLIERTVPNPPKVMNQSGELLTILPHEVMPHVQIFGQHEISELAKTPEKRTQFLKSFAKCDSFSADRKKEKREKRALLARTRDRIVKLQQEIDLVKDDLAILPSLEEIQKTYRTDLEELLKEKSLIIREEKLFSIANERLRIFENLDNELGWNLPIDAAFVSKRALDGLPNAKILSDLSKVLTTASKELRQVEKQINKSFSEAKQQIEEINKLWDKQRMVIEDNYERILRDLQKSGIDGTEYIQLREQIDDLIPKRNQLNILKAELQEYEKLRKALLEELAEEKRREWLDIIKVSRGISKQLGNRVKVDLSEVEDLTPLADLLHEITGVNVSVTIERLKQVPNLSLLQFAQHCREGKQALVCTYDLPIASAEKIAGASFDLHMRIEEIELLITAHVKMNIATKQESPVWRTLDELSTGQKVTAILLMLLLSSEAPLMLDQPEDDLDNRFITEEIVPTLQQTKNKRQFIISTHNANIPVLGDADLIVGLTAVGDASIGKAVLEQEHLGSIDSTTVRALVEETLEGGRNAFETRQLKYDF